jgi:hypothetical protein
MARRRRARKNDSAGESGNVTTTPKEGRKKMGLSAEQIQQLLGQTRQKGIYIQKINEFVESGQMGVDARDEWIEFRDKNANTLKQGFDSAKEKKEALEGAEMVKVIKSEDSVFLINLAVAGEELPELAAAAAS